MGGVLAGPTLFALATAAATVVGTVTAAPSGVAAALVVAVVVVPVVLLVARRAPSRPVVDLALRRPRGALVGIAVTGGSAVIVIGLDALTGGTRVAGVDAGMLATFVLVNTVLALVHEALPEELAFRGLTYGAVARRGSTLLAGTVTTVAFVVAPPLGIALGTVASGRPVALAPGGQHPVDYLILLALFGTVLVLLRHLTGSLWSCVAAHVTFLTVNRILLGRPGTGVAVELAPDGELLVPVYLLLAIAGLAVATGVRARRRARRDVPDPAVASR